MFPGINTSLIAGTISYWDPTYPMHPIHSSTDVNSPIYFESPSSHIKNTLMCSEKIDAEYNWRLYLRDDHLLGSHFFACSES